MCKDNCENNEGKIKRIYIKESMDSEEEWTIYHSGEHDIEKQIDEIFGLDSLVEEIKIKKDE